jgi:hypothetical protein
VNGSRGKADLRVSSDDRSAIGRNHLNWQAISSSICYSLPIGRPGNRRCHDRATPLATLAQLDRCLRAGAHGGIPGWPFLPSALDEQGRIKRARAKLIPSTTHALQIDGAAKTVEDLRRRSAEITCLYRLDSQSENLLLSRAEGALAGQVVHCSELGKAQPPPRRDVAVARASSPARHRRGRQAWSR